VVTPRRIPIVVDINVLVHAVVAEPNPERWESPPPVRGEASVVTLAILNEALEFELWLSKNLIDGTARVLRRAFGLTSDETAAYSGCSNSPGNAACGSRNGTNGGSVQWP
jgi:hypothetical protein